MVLDLTNLKTRDLGHEKFAHVPGLMSALVNYAEEGQRVGGNLNPLDPAAAILQGGAKSAGVILRAPIQIVDSVFSPSSEAR